MTQDEMREAWAKTWPRSLDVCLTWDNYRNGTLDKLGVWYFEMDELYGEEAS